MTASVLHEISVDNDERILCHVMRQIIWQTDIASSNIRVEVNHRIVYLRGTVETCMERMEAENAAKAVYGVAQVVNDLEVTPDRPHADQEIANEILSALRHSTSVLEELPDLIVRNGVVTLSGHCRWDFQKLCAERVALAIVGVQRVINLIAVNPKIIVRPVRRAADLYVVPEAS